jgi:hypothetical protein
MILATTRCAEEQGIQGSISAMGLTLQNTKFRMVNFETQWDNQSLGWRESNIASALFLHALGNLV